MSEFLADSMSHYYDYEPESTFVAEADGAIVGALLGAADTSECERRYRQHVRPLLIRRCLSGAYGWPGWLLAIVRTEFAQRHLTHVSVDLRGYPAHLHIGVLSGWRRRGIGTALVAQFSDCLEHRGVPGYHVCSSSFHPLGVAFFRKVGLRELGRFEWPFHDGAKWIAATERIFGKRLET